MPPKQLERLQTIFQDLNKALAELSFSEPVVHVYNPLLYAHRPFWDYVERYLCGPSGRTLLLGMNPGPWGMAQTGVPFGEVAAVRDWLGICAPVDEPELVHPKRPILGFDCTRSEVSGRRLWGLFQESFPKPEDFAECYFVFNYCPLIFLEESGKNRTPDKLPKAESKPMFEACDRCLRSIIEELKPARAYGVGKFALKKLQALQKDEVLIPELDSILHPSPASPAANRGWAEQVRPVLGL